MKSALPPAAMRDASPARGREAHASDPPPARWEPAAPTAGGEERAGLTALEIAAPGGRLERRYALAQALSQLAQGGTLRVSAPRRAGGLRLKAELEAFGCVVTEEARRHRRVCVASRPARPSGLAEAIAAGGPQRLAGCGLWTQPGVFSWDRLDPGTRLLIDHMGELAGAGADLGCGIGWLAIEALKRSAVTSLALVDIDGRAIAAAERNIADRRARFVHADARTLGWRDLDFIVMNPPFHAAGSEDRGLGAALVETAGAMLRRGGRLIMVANITLPYERTLGRAFARHGERARRDGYKVLEATR